MWRCFVRDQARVPSVAGAASSLFRKTEQFFFLGYKRERSYAVSRYARGERDNRTPKGMRWADTRVDAGRRALSEPERDDHKTPRSEQDEPVICTYHFYLQAEIPLA